MDVESQLCRDWKYSPASEAAVAESDRPTEKNGQTGEMEQPNPAGGAPKAEAQSVVSSISKDRIWQDRLDTISEKSRIKIQQILDEVNMLMPVELMLLYLKLPSESKEPPDPLRQPLNPLGSRSEICQTITWIKTHLEEDQDISLQKKGVYEEYRAFCELNKIKSLSTADFGKVMKQVYPRVRPRRLGTRGNSQYCYSGLRKRIKLPVPMLPDISEKPQSTESLCSKQDLTDAAWAIVKEWAETQLGVQFCSLHSLALHLVVKCSIGVGTTSASIVTSVEVSRTTLEPLQNSSIFINKHREMTLQLQRKIQQKNSIDLTGLNGRDVKRKTQSQSPKVDQKMRTKKCKVQGGVSEGILAMGAPEPPAPRAQQQPVCDKKLEYSQGLVSSTGNLGVRSPTVINQLHTLPDFSSFHRQQQAEAENSAKMGLLRQQSESNEIGGKMPVPQPLMKQIQPLMSPIKRANKNAMRALLGPAVASEQPCDNIMYNPQNAVEYGRSQEVKAGIKKKQRKRTYSNGVSGKEPLVTPKNEEEAAKITESIETSLEDDGEPIHFSRERLESISKVSKDEIECYLGNNNSQEEEELGKIFENNNTTEQQLLTDTSSVTNITQQQPFARDRQSSLSQVKQLLQQNIGYECTKPPNLTMNFKSVPTTPLPCTVSSNQQYYQRSLNARRRVSFDTNHYEESVPPSPNTRCKNLNFTPISPGPMSPMGSGHQSKCSSNNNSPFVSPRNTPVPRNRGNSHPYTQTTQKANKRGTKTKNKPDLELKLQNCGAQAMSAPPSPEMKLLQSLLQSKTSYTPNYANVQVSAPIIHTETQADVWSQLRSQSVPLPTIPEPCFTHFPFDVAPSAADSTNLPESDAGNDFNDIDTFATTENLNVSKIIDSIDLDTNNIPGVSMDVAEARYRDGMNIVRGAFLPGVSSTGENRWLNRTQSLDIEEYTAQIKHLSTRSVPATPVPYVVHRRISPERTVTGNNSRSYPSTPMTNESFTYSSQGQDFLLNGQPIKEKVTFNYLGDENDLSEYREIINEGTEELMDPQINTEEPCEIIDTDYNFDGVPDLNGS